MPTFKKFQRDGKVYKAQLRTEVFARFMSNDELDAMLGKYDAVLKRGPKKDIEEFVPTERQVADWRDWMDGTRTHIELAKSYGKSGAATMWLLAKVSRHMMNARNA